MSRLYRDAGRRRPAERGAPAATRGSVGSWSIAKRTWRRRSPTRLTTPTDPAELYVEHGAARRREL